MARRLTLDRQRGRRRRGGPRFRATEVVVVRHHLEHASAEFASLVPLSRGHPQRHRRVGRVRTGASRESRQHSTRFRRRWTIRVVDGVDVVGGGGRSVALETAEEFPLHLARPRRRRHPPLHRPHEKRERLLAAKTQRGRRRVRRSPELRARVVVVVVGGGGVVGLLRPLVIRVSDFLRGRSLDGRATTAGLALSPRAPSRKRHGTHPRA